MLHAFISYAGSDGRTAASEVARLLARQDVEVFLDTEQHLSVTNPLKREISEALAASRVLVAVLTDGYRASSWTRQEYELARELKKDVVHVIMGGNRASVRWLDEDVPEWFVDQRIIEAGPTAAEKVRGEEELVDAVAPAPFIIRAAADANPNKALANLDEILSTWTLKGLQLLQVRQYRSELLRLAGRRKDARTLIEEMRFFANDPHWLIEKTVVTSAQLQLDERDWETARAHLAEAVAVLHRSDAWRSDDVRRRKLLAEVTREIARSYLEETLYMPEERSGCTELETAWALYMEALALVTDSEDPFGHAWVHNNLGMLLAQYARRTAAMTPLRQSQITGLDYPAITSWRGDTAGLLKKSLDYLQMALTRFGRLADGPKSREGLAWSHYHTAETLRTQARNGAAIAPAIRELEKAGDLFDGIAEGQGVTFTRLAEIYFDLEQTDQAVSYANKAIPLIESSEKHRDIAEKLRSRLQRLEE